MTIFIHHHLGLGDHIICNGLVNYLKDKYLKEEKVTIATKIHNVTSVSRLYNIDDILPVKDDLDAVNVYKNYSTPVRIGFEYCRSPKWEESFYEQFKIPYQCRWDYFKVHRDLSVEEKLFNTLNPNNKDYKLICDTGSIGKYNLTLTDDGLLPVYLSNKTNSLFDWMYTISKAKKIHTIDTSFVHLVLQSKYSGELIYHDVGRDRSNLPSFINYNIIYDKANNI